MMSSRYTKMKGRPLVTLSIILWKVLPAVAEPESHPQELVQAERRDDGGLGDIPGMHGDLMVALAQIHLAEDAASGHLRHKVHHIRQWV